MRTDHRRGRSRRDSGFTCYDFEIQNAIKPGKRNTLAVQVRQITRDYMFDARGDRPLGGIFRGADPRARLQQGETVALEKRGATCEFDPSACLLSAASAKGRNLIHDLRPTSGGR